MPNVAELLTQAQALPHGPAQVALFEEAVRLADAAGDGIAGYESRAWLIHAAALAEREELLPVMLAWNLAYYDAHADELDAGCMLNSYRTVMWWVPALADVPKATVLALFDDLERRTRQHGESTRLFHSYRRQGMLQMNDFAAAARSHGYLQRHPLKPWEADALTAASEDTGYLLERKRYKAALARAEPALATGQRSEVEPQQLLASILLALLKANRMADAAAAQKRSASLIRRDTKKYPNAWRKMTAYFVHTGQFPAAKRALEAKLPIAFGRASLSSRCDWCRVGHLFAEGLKRSGQRAVTMRLPEGSPSPDARGRFEVEALSEWFRAEAASSAARLDARNGNTWWADFLAEVPGELEWARRFWA